MPSKSKSQQRFFGVVKAMQKGDMPKKGEAGKAAKSMTKKDVDDFAKTTNRKSEQWKKSLEEYSSNRMEYLKKQIKPKRKMGHLTIIENK